MLPNPLNELSLTRPLRCHNTTPDDAVERLVARVTLLEGALCLDFTTIASLERLAIPDRQPTTRADRLWEHSCFEAFWFDAEGDGYTELNLSPSTAWAVYHFERYREGGRVEDTLVPTLTISESPRHLVVAARIPMDTRLLAHGLRMGLSAVIEDGDGHHSYWALHHPSPKPDFHHPDAFVLNLRPTTAVSAERTP